MLQFSGEPWLEYGLGYNQEFFSNLAGLKVWCFFSNFKANFLIVTLLFCPQNFTTLSPQCQKISRKEKKHLSQCHKISGKPVY
jgi:hypothetical protein